MGLWGFSADGYVQSLGRARNFRDFASEDPEIFLIRGFVAARDGTGLWAVTSDGHVNTLGRVRDFGDFPGGGTCCSGLVAPTNGEGLWRFSANGHVQSLGSAPDRATFPLRCRETATPRWSPHGAATASGRSQKEGTWALWATRYSSVT